MRTHFMMGGFSTRRADDDEIISVRTIDSVMHDDGGNPQRETFHSGRITVRDDDSGDLCRKLVALLNALDA